LTLIGDNAFAGEGVDKVGATVCIAPRVTGAARKDSDQEVTEPATFVATSAEEIYLPGMSAVIERVLPVMGSSKQFFVAVGSTVVASVIAEAQLHHRIVVVGAGVPSHLPSVESITAPT
jgi:hypothetical protein